MDLPLPYNTVLLQGPLALYRRHPARHLTSTTGLPACSILRPPPTQHHNCCNVLQGPLALYRGLPAQLVGIMPEKALKLTLYNALRTAMIDKEVSEL